MRPPSILLALLLTGAAAAQSVTREGGPGALTATFIGNEAWHITDGEYAVMTDFPYESGYSRYMTWDSSGVPKIADPGKLLIVTTHQHRDHFAAELMPESKIVTNHSGKACQNCGETTGMRPKASAEATMIMLLLPL
mgnify:CR=1 FL=1